MAEVKTGKCHCGTVEFEVTLDNGLEDIWRCNCSLCRRKGALMSFVSLSNLRITKGENALTLYQWNTQTAKHYFCKICGIYTHHLRRSDTTQLGFNVACIDDIDPFSLEPAATADGASMSKV